MAGAGANQHWDYHPSGVGTASRQPPKTIWDKTRLESCALSSRPVSCSRIAASVLAALHTVAVQQPPGLYSSRLGPSCSRLGPSCLGVDQCTGK